MSPPRSLAAASGGRPRGGRRRLSERPTLPLGLGLVFPSATALRLTLPLWLVLAFPSAGAADWRDAFAAGVKARDKGQWAEAARQMQLAIGDNPNATGEQVRVYGMKFERYLPYYYLGVALYKQSDCQGALASFTQSRAAQAVGPAGRSNMKGMEKDCRHKLGLPAVARRPAAQPPPTPRPQTSKPGRSTTPPPPATRPRRPPTAPPPAVRTRPAPGRTTPGQTTPGRPAPGRPTPGRTTPGRTRGTPAPPPAGTGSLAPPSRPSAPPKRPADVRKQVMQQKADDVKGILGPAGDLAGDLERHLQRSNNAAFRGRPELEQRYHQAYRELNGIRARLRAAEREGDLREVERLAGRAKANLEELERLAGEIRARTP